MINSPQYPVSYFNATSSNKAAFMSYSAFNDPADKSVAVINDAATIPNWFLNMRYKGGIENMLGHRGIHNGLPCNILRGNKILLHIKTAGVFSFDIFFQVSVKIENTAYGSMVVLDFDPAYKETSVKAFHLVFWVFRHPTQKSLDIAVVRGYIMVSGYDVGMFGNKIKWSLDNILQNMAEKVNK